MLIFAVAMCIASAFDLITTSTQLALRRWASWLHDCRIHAERIAREQPRFVRHQLFFWARRAISWRLA